MTRPALILLAALAVTAGLLAAATLAATEFPTRSGNCVPEFGRLLTDPVSSSRRFSSVKMAL